VLPDGTFGPKCGLPDGGTEVLELKPDGTCEQNIALKDGRKFSATGTWKYEGGYVEVEGIRISTKDGNINPNIEEIAIGRIISSVGRDFLGSLIIGSREYTHYEKK
jgi:hypothetical protein